MNTAPGTAMTGQVAPECDVTCDDIGQAPNKSMVASESINNVRAIDHTQETRNATFYNAIVDDFRFAAVKATPIHIVLSIRLTERIS